MQQVQNFKHGSMERACALFFFLLLGMATFAQTTAAGKVKDSGGEPLVGVSVLELGTNNGTVTDVNGRYSLTVKNGAQLKISYVGFVPQTIKAKGNSVVIMQEDHKTLNEVVVVGYGTMRRKDVTSSITTVSEKDLNQGVYTDPAQLLQGKVAGLVVTTNGNPSGEPSITLRGASTLRTGEAQQPYYIIDGIPGVDLSLVSPDDIESIDVLRDATATAIYGSKAANGVIIITTKKGRKGRTNVSYNAYVAIDRVAKNLDMMSASELRSYAAENNLTIPNDEGADSDWQKEVQRTGFAHNHNVSINGGNDKTTYNASINYMNREGVIKGTNMNRLNGRALVSTKILKDHLKLALGLNASQGNFESVLGNGDGASVNDAMNYYSPLVPVYNEDGSYYESSGISMNYNPLAMINQDRFKNTRRRMMMTGNAELTIVDGLTWSANYSYMNRQNIFSGYNSVNSQVVKKNGQAERNTYFGHSQVFETFGNFSKTFNKVHSMGIMLGYSWEEKLQGDGFGVTVYNFYNDDLTYHNLTYASSIDGISAVESKGESILRMISFYGRMNYSYKSKYNFQATLRRDGSSAFGKNNRWATFPSVSAAWRLSEEPFIKNLNVFDDLKLRAGYGVSGNSLGFDAYSAIRTYGASGWFTASDGSTYRTLAATNNANPNLKWEKTGMLNVGLDFSFFGSRLNGTVEYYVKKTSDLIYGYNVSTLLYPYGTMMANVGDISNRGIEFTLNAVPVSNNNWNWSTMLNLAYNSNKVDKLSNATYSVKYIDEAQPDIAGNTGVSVQRLMEGQPIGTYYTWEWAGYSDTGVSQFYVHDATTGKRTGEVTTSPEDKDRTIVGNAQPDLTFGWNNTITYKKSWTLTAFFTGVLGDKVYNCSRDQYSTINLITMGKNVLSSVATDQLATDVNAQMPSDRYIEDGSYLRLQTLSLSYTFKSLADWMTSLTVYGTMNNVFTITGYKGIDPEVELSGLTPGMDWRHSWYPHTRSFMLGVKINF